MALEIQEYGPILPHVIAAAEEIVHMRATEFHVPAHPEAVGMAADIEFVLRRLDPALKYVANRGTPSPDAQSLRDSPLLSVVFTEGDFIVPPPETFVDFPRSARMRKCGSDLQIDVQARPTPPKYRHAGTSHAIDIAKTLGIDLPPERWDLTVSFAFNTIGGYPAGTIFQHFPQREPPVATTSFAMKKQRYPVSAQDTHAVGADTFGFFTEPLHWFSASQYLSRAFDKMSGEVSYEDAVNKYHDERIPERAREQEKVVVRIIKGLVENRTLTILSRELGCPGKYHELYLGKFLKSVWWLCNPDSLKAPRKHAYLKTLSAAFRDYGLEITPDRLANLSFRRAGHERAEAYGN